MARDIEESDYYVSHGGMVPVKWTALEVCMIDSIINVMINCHPIHECCLHSM